jgi:hypothetical protein
MFDKDKGLRGGWNRMYFRAFAGIIKNAYSTFAEMIKRMPTVTTV